MDHRDIGRQQELFMFSDYSPGCPIWLPNGHTIYSLLQNKMRTLNAEFGYTEVRTPMMWKPGLYETSGHWDHFRDNMFIIHGKDVSGDKVSLYPEYALKPMNCPGHMEIYKSKVRSYRDLPVRISDQTVLHRNETSGALGGLFRCRSFAQDDGHCFINQDDIGSEIGSILGMIKRVYYPFDMPMRFVLSTRPAKFMGTHTAWDVAESKLHVALEDNKLVFEIAKGQGAFYGPKIDCIVTDSQGRDWQTATIQLDFQLPERFDLNFVGEDNKNHRPIVVHRAIYGSFERFIGILLEHYNGALPCWLAPTQVVMLPIAERHAEYARTFVYSGEHGVRATVDDSNNTLNQKILVAQTNHIPYMGIVGDREVKDGMVSVRDRTGKNESMMMGAFYEFVDGQNRFSY